MSNPYPAKLSPIGEVDSWYRGIPIVKIKGRNFDVTSYYEKKSSDGYVFNVGVLKKAPGSIDLSLENTLCIPISPSIVEIEKSYSKKEMLVKEESKKHSSEEIYYEEVLQPERVINPEQLVAQYQNKLKGVEHEPLIVSLLDTTVAVADIFVIPKTEEERKAQEERRREREEREESKKREIAELKASISELETTLFRKHTLKEGEATSGAIVCPRDTLLGEGLVLYIQIEEEVFPFRWQDE